MQTVQQTPAPTKSIARAAKWIVVFLAVAVLAIVVGGGIWQRMRAEEALRRNERLAAVGQLIRLVGPPQAGHSIPATRSSAM